MNDSWDEIVGRFKVIAGSWAAYSALGTFFLYLSGYLSLRFNLLALGIYTDLAVLDERYLFAGAKILFWLMLFIPMILLIILLSMAAIFLPYIVLPFIVKARIKNLIPRCREIITSWLSISNRLCLFGLIFSVMMIQMVMVQCLYLNNLLLDQKPQGAAWVVWLLLGKNQFLCDLFFMGLVAWVILIIILLFFAKRIAAPGFFSCFTCNIFSLLVIFQILLLPVNFGILLSDKDKPRVAEIGDKIILEKNEKAWLIWEGDQGITFLVQKMENCQDRTLVTLPKKDIKTIKVIGHDNIFQELFGKTQVR